MDAKSKKGLVVDSSFVLAFLLPDERSAAVDDIFESFAAGKISLYSAELLPYEVLNGLKSAVLRKRLTSETAARLGHDFLDLPFILEKIDGRRCWELAWREKLTIYDAAYLTVARSPRRPLLSLDTDLKPFSSPF